MDLITLKEYLEYEPITDSNPQFIVDEIKTLAGEYLNLDDIKKIQDAYDFALMAHNGQKRLSGEYYVTHVVCATRFLMKIKPDLYTIQACILHDIIEDTSYEFDDIKKRFGDIVAKLCASLVKVSKIRYRGEERQIETLKKTFLAMGEDLRVIFIKLADRIHNIQTLHFHPKKEKRKRIALETLKIYVPIAQRLGLAVFQGYLENGSFKILNSKEFYRIMNYVSKEYGSSKDYVNKGISTISELLNSSGIKFDGVSGRFKSPYRIYKKLKKYGTNDIGKILDILAFRILTDSISDCYNVLGFMHGHYTPIIKNIKDYIAVPKVNGYRSLHTVILGMFDFPIEIQIRTNEMDEVAEYGIAAHFAYKEYGFPTLVTEKQSQWIQKLQDLVKEFQEDSSKEKFKDALQVEILDNNIFVYTPAGDVVELSYKSTVLDFAFKIHTDVGLKFKHAFVNGKPVPIDYEPNTGDIVDIKTYKNKYTASKSWYDYLHIHTSKSKLGRFLKQLEKGKYIDFGTRLLNDKLKEYGLPLIGGKGDNITKLYKGEELENLLIRISDRQVTLSKFIKDLYKSHFDNSDTLQSIVAKDTKTEGQKINVIVDRDKTLDYSLCPECKPKLGDKIIAKVGKEGIKIHTLKCKGMKDISFDKLLEAHFEGNVANKYIFSLELMVEDKPGILLQILTIFYDLDINMSDIQVRKGDDKKSYIDINLELFNPSKSFYVIKELKNRKNLLRLVGWKIS